MYFIQQFALFIRIIDLADGWIEDQCIQYAQVHAEYSLFDEGECLIHELPATQLCRPSRWSVFKRIMFIEEFDKV